MDNILAKRESSGKFFDLTGFKFDIIKSKDSNKYYITLKDNLGVYGIPVPDFNCLTENESQNNLQYIENIFLNIFDELDLVTFFDENNYIIVYCDKDMIDKIKLVFHKLNALEENIFYSLSNINLSSCDDYFILNDKTNFNLLFNESARYNELVFRMLCAGFEEKDSNKFMIKNGNDIDNSLKRFYNLFK